MTIAINKPQLPNFEFSKMGNHFVTCKVGPVTMDDIRLECETTKGLELVAESPIEITISFKGDTGYRWEGKYCDLEVAAKAIKRYQDRPFKDYEEIED